MKNPERVFNWLLGISILSWAFLGLLNNSTTKPLLVQLSIAALHLAVGYLVINRQRVNQHGSISACIIATPAVLAGGLSMHRGIEWHAPAQAFLVIGVAIAITSFAYLGKSFAILPAKRDIVISGPYRWVRHPAYLGELFMLIGCASGSPMWLALFGITIILFLLAIRIIAEENLLANDQRYQQYQSKVRFRLIPGIW